MKQNYLFTRALIAMCFMAIFGSFSMDAQTWDPPMYEGEVPTSGSAYYIYNLGSEAFINRGGSWTTMAVATAKPQANASSSIVSWTVVNTTGSEYTFQYTYNGSPTGGNYLFAVDAAAGSSYTDGSANNNWTLTEVDATDHIYTAQGNSAMTNYDASFYLGVTAAAESSNKGMVNPVKWNLAAGDDYTKWIFVSQANFDLYKAKVVLDRYMRYADGFGGIDLSGYIATYNAGVAADITTAASTLATQLSKTDVTASISSPSFEDGFTGWTNDGFVTQGNSPDGTGMTKDGATYAERYIWHNSDGTSLPASSITQDLTGLENGLYELSFSGHAVQQAGANPLYTGAFLVVGEKSVEVSAGGTYVVDSIVVTDGTLTIGYQLTGTITCNWTGFDNFKLYKFSEPVADAVISVSETSFLFSAADLEKTFTIIGANLTSDITLTAPAGVTLSKTTITAAEGNALGGVTITATGTDRDVDGDISITSTEFDTETISCLSGVATGIYYTLTQNSTGLMLGASSATSPAVMTADVNDSSQVFAFIPTGVNTGNYSIINGAGTYLAKTTGNTWTAAYESALNGNYTSWELYGTDYFTSGLRLKVLAQGYLASDGTTSGSSVYADKSSGNANGLYILSEAQVVVIHYVDGDGNTLKMSRVDARGLVTGATYTATAADKASFIVGSTTYEYDATSTDNVTVTDGTAEITLSFEEAALSADATLSSLSVDAGIFPGSFSADKTTYEVLVPAGISSITVSAVVNNAGAVITSGTGTVDVSGGNTSTDVLVTAEDNITTKTYTINFTVSATDYIFGWDGNTMTGSGTTPFDFGWETASDVAASDVDGSGGTRIRIDPAGYTYEDGGATVTGRQLLLRYDYGNEADAWTFPVTLEANTVYAFNFDYVYGGSGTPPGILSAGVGTTNDVNSDVAIKEFETADENTKYRSGTLAFTTGEAGVYYVKFTMSERCWVGVSNLELVDASDATLISLTGNGFSVEDFAGTTLAYDFYVPLGEAVPTLEAIASDAGASVEIEQATTMPDTATIVVTGTSGVSLTYMVYFSEFVPVNNDLVSESAIDVYPSVSANGVFNVITSGNETTITVYDLSGKVVYQQAGMSTREVVTLNKAGMYMFKVESEGVVNTFKVLKN